MIDLNLLYTYATSTKNDRRVLLSDYLSAQALTKNTKQDWSRFFEAVITERLYNCTDAGKQGAKLEPIDYFVMCLNEMGFSLSDFFVSLKKCVPLENNPVDKFFYSLTPDSRIFASFNEIRERGNIAFFHSVVRPKKEYELRQIANANFLFQEIVKVAGPNRKVIEKALVKMVHEPSIEMPGTRGYLERAELFVLMSCFFLSSKDCTLKKEILPREIRDNYDTVMEYFDLLGSSQQRNLMHKRNALYENIICSDAVEGCMAWCSDDNIIDGLVEITAGDDELYDFDVDAAATVPVGQIMKHEHTEIVSKMIDIKTKIDKEFEQDNIDDNKLNVIKPFRVTKQQCDQFKSQIIGQRQAVNTIVDKLTSVACGFITPDKPIASVLLNGPTGVGKTETAKAISSIFFDNKMYTVDMSTFKHEADLSRLTGSAPGYVGYDDPNGFIDFCMENPRSVLLFDEIDKCAPSCLSFLLRVLDEGKFTTARGEVVDLSKAMIIATTNQKANISANSANKNLDEMTSRTGESGSPFVKELLGRFDNLLEYSELTNDDLKLILEQKLNVKKQNFEQQNNGMIVLGWTDNLLDEIMRDSKAKLTGARALHSSIDKVFIRPISKYIVENGMPQKGQIVVDNSKKLYVNGKEILVDTGVKIDELPAKTFDSSMIHYG